MSDEYPTARYATPRDLRAAYPLTPSDVAQQQAAALLFGQAGPAPQHPLFGNAARAKPARVIKLKRQRDDADVAFFAHTADASSVAAARARAAAILAAATAPPSTGGRKYRRRSASRKTKRSHKSKKSRTSKKSKKSRK